MCTGKIRSPAAACAWRRDLTGRVVFTNGVFDLLHPGHVALLEGARALGDHLVVGINDDPSAQRLDKGPGRPVVPAVDRARLVAAMEAVDCVVIFEEDTPATLIAALAPDVLAKGSDYDPGEIPGREHVVERGGSVTVVPLLEGYSTSSLLARARTDAAS